MKLLLVPGFDALALKSDLAPLARKTDLAGFLSSIPVATTAALGGVKLYSSTRPATGDRTCGVMVNDQGGYLRPMPAQINGGLHWAGVVNAYADYNPDLPYAFSDVYNAAAVTAIIESLKARIKALEDKLATMDVASMDHPADAT